MQGSGKGELVDMFLDRLRCLSLAHHVRGRIRIKVSWTQLSRLMSTDSLPSASDIEAFLSRMPGIRGCRINRKALSMVIEYDESIWPYRLWEELAALDSNPGSRGALREELLALWAAHAGAQPLREVV